MLRYRTQGLLAVGLALLAGGCFGEPEIRTNLRPEGPPEVLAVMAIDPYPTKAELPAFCRYVNGVLDEKGPGANAMNAQLGFLGVGDACPDAEADFTPYQMEPLGWDLRIMFDELLDGDSVENLICDADGDGLEDDPITTCIGTIVDTHPVTLTCGGTELAYDGYYVPNGSKDTFPVGPSLVVQPDASAVPTGTACTLTIGSVVVDKSGEPVGSGADIGTFSISVAPLTLLYSDPEDAEDVGDRAVLDPDGAIAFVFNANLDDTSVDAADFEIVDGTGTVVASDFAVDAYNDATDAIYVFGAADLADGQYTARLKSGASFSELNGGTATLSADFDVRFVVEAAP
jgi:hypothetical protein